jgi:segregation and condensation protein A
MEDMAVEVAADFLVMAAHLAYLKSRELVPSPEPLEAGDEGEEPLDPREELIRRLLEYQKYKHAAENLGSRPIEGRNVFVRGAVLQADSEAGLAEHSVWKLIEHWASTLKKAKPEYTHDVVMDRMSISDRINQIVDLLEAGKGMVRFEDLLGPNLAPAELRHKVVVSLLAVLELAKLHIVRILQEESTGTFFLAQVEGAAIDEARSLMVTSARQDAAEKKAESQRAAAEQAQAAAAAAESAAVVPAAGEQAPQAHRPAEPVDAQAEADPIDPEFAQLDEELAQVEAELARIDAASAPAGNEAARVDSEDVEGEGETDQIIVDVAQVDTDELAPADAESAPVAADFAPSDAELAPLESDLAPLESELAPPDAEFAPPDAEFAPPDAEFAPPDAEFAPPDTELAPPDTELAPPDAEFAPPDAEFAPPDAEFAPPDAELAPVAADATPTPSQAAPAAADSAPTDSGAAKCYESQTPDAVSDGEREAFELRPEEEVMSASSPASAATGEEATDGQTQEEQTTPKE